MERPYNLAELTSGSRVAGLATSCISVATIAGRCSVGRLRRNFSGASSTGLIDVVRTERDGAVLPTVEQVEQARERLVLGPLLPEFDHHLTVVQHGPANETSMVVRIVDRRGTLDGTARDLAHQVGAAAKTVRIVHSVGFDRLDHRVIGGRHADMGVNARPNDRYFDLAVRIDPPTAGTSGRQPDAWGAFEQ